MLHKISLATCCCDQDTPSPPTGTLGTAVFSVNASVSVTGVGGCQAIVPARRDDTIIEFSLSLIFESALRISSFLTNGEVRSALIDNLTDAGGDPDFCSYFDSHVIPNQLSADVSITAVELGAFGGPPYRWDAGLSFSCSIGATNNSQSMSFSSNQQQGLLDPGVATPLTVTNRTWFAGANPVPPGEVVDEPFFDDTLSFLAITGSR